MRTVTLIGLIWVAYGDVLALLTRGRGGVLDHLMFIGNCKTTVWQSYRVL